MIPRTGTRTGMRKALRGQPRRFLAAALAMALSVAFVASTLLLLASARSGIERAVAGQYERADVVLEPSAEITPSVLAAISATPGVQAVAATATAFAEATWGATARSKPILIDLLAGDRTLRWQRPVEGGLPSAVGEIALEQDRAAASRLRVGSSITVADPAGGAQTLTVVGLYEGSPMTDNGYLMTEAGARAIDPYVSVSEVVVRADDGVDPATLAGALASTVGPGWLVTTADEHVATLVAGLTGDIDVLGLFLLGFAVVALVVAALVIANTFMIVLAQRTRELALLRCVGASRSQVFGSVLTQALGLGLVAGTVGVLGGVGLSAAVLGLAGRIDLPFPVDDLTLTPLALLAPVLVGLVVSVVSAVVPAYRATKVAPVAALQPTQIGSAASRAGVARLVLALAALGLGGALLGAGALSGTLPIGLAGGVLSFLGILLAGPVLLPALVRLLGLLPARTGVPARLARLDAVRNPGRTAATSSALLVGVTLIATMTVGAASMERSVAASLDSQLPVDLMVDAGGSTLPGGLTDEMVDLDGVTGAVGLRGVTSDVAGTPVHLLGLDPAAAGTVVRGDMVDGLRDGVVLVPPQAADEFGLSDGNKVRLGRLDLVVTSSYGLDSSDLLVTAADLDRIEPDAQLVAVWAKVATGVSPLSVFDGAEGLVADVPDVEVSGGLAQRASYEAIFELMLLVATVLLGVAILIALVGVGNTLSLSVLERAREHGLLRALGMTRAQLAAMLGTEAALMALAAAVLGLGLGVAYGIAGTMTVLGTATDQVALVVPFGRYGLIVVVAALAGLAAAVLPARRAARTSPVAALSHD